MKIYRFIPLFLISIILFSCNQVKPIAPDLKNVTDALEWTVFNREVNYESKVVHLDAKAGSGLVKLNDLIVGDGTIELDIKGKNAQGESFVGLAFHGLNDSTYDAVYFRPFNFENPERNTHSVQYVAEPKYPWHVLREKEPGEFENKLDKVPDPDSWFHVKIIIGDHMVKAYVDNSETPSLEVKQISHRHEGWLGFWVGHNSEGWFKNLEIWPAAGGGAH